MHKYTNNEVYIYTIYVFRLKYIYLSKIFWVALAPLASPLLRVCENLCVCMCVCESCYRTIRVLFNPLTTGLAILMSQ